MIDISEEVEEKQTLAFDSICKLLLEANKIKLFQPCQPEVQLLLIDVSGSVIVEFPKKHVELSLPKFQILFLVEIYQGISAPSPFIFFVLLVEILPTDFIGFLRYDHFE